MKIEDIHKDLEKKDMRDFIQDEMLEIPYECERSTKSIEEKIKKLQEELKLTKKFNSLKDIIEMNDWEEWDISDETGLRTDKKYAYFYGTEEEYETFIKKFEEK